MISYTCLRVDVIGIRISEKTNRLQHVPKQCIKTRYKGLRSAPLGHSPQPGEYSLRAEPRSLRVAPRVILIFFDILNIFRKITQSSVLKMDTWCKLTISNKAL